MVTLLTTAILASIVLAVPAFASDEDGVNCGGNTYLYSSGINNGTPVTTHSGVIFYWYENTVKQTGTIVQSYPIIANATPNLKVEHFRQSNGTMVLHFYVQDPTGTAYMNIYSALPLDYSGVAPAYTMIFWDTSTGDVSIDINGTGSAPGPASFTLGVPFVTPTNNLPWTVCGSLLAGGGGTNYYNGAINQLFVDQDDDDYTLMATPNAIMGAFVSRDPVAGINKPLDLGFLGTGVFGINHGAPMMYLHGDATLFPQNILSNSFLVVGNPLTTVTDFSWNLYP